MGYNLYVMKISNKKLTAVLRKRSLDRLLNEIKMVKSATDLDKFFGEIFTKDEKEIILRRMIVADMLERKLKYREIEEALGISRLTISKVRDMLAKRGYGRNPGRKRAYSSNTDRKKRRQKPLLGYYKGAASII
jgi:TrpR-related protein YerC/YecD